jgi:hypothetical protein
MKLWLASLIAFSMVFQVSLFARNTDHSFPKEIVFTVGGQDFQLQETGVATREKFIVRIYNVASYLQDASSVKGDKFAAFLDDERAKQLTIVWLRELDAEKVRDGFEISFNKVLDEDKQAKLKPQIDQFLGFFEKDIDAGSSHILRWIPGGQVSVMLDDTPLGTITNVDFAKALWSIWFSKDSVVERNDLVSLMK